MAWGVPRNLPAGCLQVKISILLKVTESQNLHFKLSEKKKKSKLQYLSEFHEQLWLICTLEVILVIKGIILLNDIFGFMRLPDKEDILRDLIAKHLLTPYFKLFIWLYISSTKPGAPWGQRNGMKNRWTLVWVDHVFNYWLCDLGQVI